MASKTTNYGLNKHSPQDFYNVEARNENWDKIDEALAATDEAINGFSVNTADLSAIDIHNAWEALGKVSGETADEAIIDEIFSKFCVGK